MSKPDPTTVKFLEDVLTRTEATQVEPDVWVMPWPLPLRGTLPPDCAFQERGCPVCAGEEPPPVDIWADPTYPPGGVRP